MARLILLAAVLVAAGCRKDAPPPPPAATETAPLPPEVEYDPATAAKAKQQHRR